MSYLRDLAEVLIAAFTIVGVLAHLISRTMEHSIDRRFTRWSNTPDGEEHWFSKNDKWWRSRGHGRGKTHGHTD